MDYQEFLSTCDLQIKSGQINLVAASIRDLNISQVPRKWRQALGKICRRSGMIEHGLRLLHPVIRGERQLEEPAQEFEISEYAVLLSRNGSVQEALDLLQKVDKSKAPEALMYEGFCRISQWDYVQASECFRNFLSSDSDSYSKLIARVNLVACYIASLELDLAEPLVQETLQIAEDLKAQRLVGNCYELRGQIAFFRDHFPEARIELAKSLEVLGVSGSYDQLLVSKWLRTMEALESNSTAPLQAFRQEALTHKHWESVRDTDYYQLKIKFEQNAFDHLLFGSPSAFYRARVLREITQQPSCFFNFGKAGCAHFDLQTGILNSTDESIAGTKIHQMIAVLLKDFYAPRNMGTLFSELYPDEYFDIDSSPLRVRQILRRTRRWLEANNIPAEIKESGGSYRFVLNGPFAVRIPFDRFQIDGNTALWQKLRRTFQPLEEFTAEEACEKLATSRTSFHRFTLWALEHQLLTKSGNNKSTCYQLGTGSSKLAA